MAVGKGSMARAGKAADTEVAAINHRAADTGMAAENPSTGKKTTIRKRTSQKAAAQKNVEAVAVIASVQEETMEEIIYQKSFQVLDRAVEENESFQIGEAMPIYYY